MRHLRLVLLAIAAGAFAAGCTKSTPAPAPVTGSNATTSIDEHEGHDHEGHTHEGESATTSGEPAPGTGAAPGDEFGAPSAEPKGGAEPEISLDPAAPAAPENE
jgi:hypothetical protein